MLRLQILKNFSRYSNWEVSDKATLEPSKTCHEEQGDGSCKSVHIPSCVDRTVRCSPLPNPNGVLTRENNYLMGCSDCATGWQREGPVLGDWRAMDSLNQ